MSKWCDVNGKINYNGGLPCIGMEGKHQNLVCNQGSNSHWPCFGHGETLSFENNYWETTIQCFGMNTYKFDSLEA